MNLRCVTRLVSSTLGIAATLGLTASTPAQVGGGLSTTSSASAQLAQAMSQAGLTVCATKVQQVADFLFENAPAAIRVQPLGPDANRWPTVISIESSHVGGGTTRFSTVMIAPAGTCSGFYQQVIFWPQPCEGVKKSTFSAFQNERPLLKNVRISSVNAALQVALMPAGSGCVSIKKELLH